ncbi:MAG TPA: hypothetical protein VGN72_14375 [Tepidisphaeraceae bacterium]|jgi:hypothetical protein|nr:hypothetical protein [Tepidisphaeraceae bacterium]
MTPTPLIESLQSFRRRVRMLTLVTGVGYALAAAIGMVLAVVLVDYLLNLQAVLRIAVMVAVAVGIGGILARYVVRPLVGKLPLTDIAGRLEEAFPQFDDRVRSTVNFMAGGEVHGSGVMKQHVIDQATSLVQSVDLNRAIATKPVKQASGLAAGAVALLVLLALLWPSYLKIGLMRLVAPFSSTAWPKWVQIDMIEAPPARVPVGQPIPIKLKLSRGDRASRDVSVHYRNYTGTGALMVADGPEREEFMTRNEDGTYSAALDAKLAQAAAAGTLVAWVEAGDDRVDLTPIVVVPRLAIERVEAAITPPPYAKLPPTTVNLADMPAVVAAGSTVQLSVAFNKPLASADVAIEPLATDVKLPEITWARAGGSSGETASIGTFSPTESLRFHLRATDADGFQNPAIEEYEIIVRPDQSPTVQIEEPRRNEERTAVALVSLRAIAEDDFAISDATLWVERLSDRVKWELPLVKDEAATGNAMLSPGDSSPDRRRYRIAYAWELSELADANLQSGDVLEYCIGVTDNYALHGATHPPAYSGKLRITIISQEEFAARIGDELRAAAAAVNEARNAQTRTNVETANIADETKDKPKLDDADRTAIERLANQQSSAAATVRQVASRLENVLERLDENRSPNNDLRETAKDARDLLNRTAEGPMKDAGRQLATAKDRQQNEADPQKSTEERNADLKDAQNKQETAADDLQKAMERLGNTGSLSQTIQQFRSLLADQQRVSKDTKDFANENRGKSNLTPEEQKELEKLVADQKKLADLTEKAIEDANRAAEQLQKTDPATAESLKQAASTAKQQQVSPSQQQASSSMKQNQQTPAQAAQKKAELGLEMVINALRDAEKRKLEELAKKLAEMQQQLAMLVKRQAGHNIDNLRLQGPDVLEKTNADVLTDLAEKAGRMVSEIKEGKEPAVTLGQLSASQQQTERNTRDLSRTAEDTQDGAQLAAALTRAAGRMERALVSLRASKLPEAYDPPQVEALAALVDAKRVLDEQQRKAEEKIEQQQNEAIRARYEKIKVEQEKLNADTNRMDLARDKAGKLVRPHSVNILKMPGEQGKLADATKAIEEDLSGAGAIVYVWANKDIVEAMNTVKDALGEQRTDAEVQIEQQRIVEQLDAMIRNLSIKPPERKFDQKQGAGGGGGGQGAARLPSEAELRLLKDLQSAVNNATKKLAALVEKQEQKLQGLGGRQGELRGVLGELIENASKGQMTIGDEPDNRDQLPEEANAENIEDQELEQELLNDEPDTQELQKGVNRVGDRMARSRQRLAINHDPGKVTQEIQKRILLDIDELIQEARNQQAQSQPSPGQGQGQGQQMAEAKPGEGQGGKPQPAQGRPAGAEAAQESNRGQGVDPSAEPSADIKETMAEWGRITPRLRAAVVEGQGEQPIEKYKALVDDYYRALAERRD